MVSQKIIDKLKLTPHTSGVYVMYNNASHIIYVGKAKDLYNRLTNYFINKVHNTKTQALVSNIEYFDYFVTANEKDALALECNLIKQHKPRYNVLLKDSKTFPYIKINIKEEFPSIEIVRRVKKDGNKYFGPYFSGLNAYQLLDVIRQCYGVRQCKGKLSKPCLNLQMGLCLGPCANKVSKEDYKNTIEKVKNFLSGKNTLEVEQILQQKMLVSSEMQNFELALMFRESIKMVQKLKDKNIAITASGLDADVFACACEGDVCAVSTVVVRGGFIVGVINSAVNIDAVGDVLEQFIPQFYAGKQMPEVIILEQEIGGLDNVFVPKNGYKLKLLKLAIENAKEYVSKQLVQIEYKQRFTLGACEQLANVLSLNKILRRIECYDISNISGQLQVASMVVFIDGEPDKKSYRKFKIKHTEGPNDFLSMNETLNRRMARIEDKTFGEKPDLIIIDGGKGQLGAVKEIISGIDYIGLAKENEEIFKPGVSQPIVLERNSLALRLIQRIRDEAHRFAITFHRSLRDKDFIKPKKKAAKKDKE